MLDTRHSGSVHDLMSFPAATSWARAASHCRFNINPLFTASGMDLDRGGVPQIRREALVQLMQKCVSEAAPAHYFPLVLGQLFAFDHLPALETFLTTTPTLRQALPALQWVSRTLPSNDFHIETSGPQAALVVDVDLPCDNVRVHGYFVESVLAALARIVRLTTGSTALVLHVEVQHDPGPQRAACEAHFGVPVHIHRPRNIVVFQSRLLDLPLPGAVPDLHRRAQQQVEQQLPEPGSSSMVASLVKLFRQHPHLMGQGIERLAERLNVHPRTLQRRLREEGEPFGDIQARCRYERAITALKAGPTTDIEALSEQLGFSDRHSFTRAFRRWTGLAPSEFRRQHQEQHQSHPSA
ncbi:MAG TPA: helix-turn-helix domain-containing protein [Aquabacterium sp.]|uniref:helix-turn-helix domain-containing protein n=1 Tax=Aquabacterium sp. TaxID=1872578 RepID=UPI002E3009EB|nr:helix-turn-helix domain-containing protein [Aquabacterium sp.]HEX5374507.1 helix-turn-helix domain-containing protein [Aquabacterium sp.]